MPAAKAALEAATARDAPATAAAGESAAPFDSNSPPESAADAETEFTPSSNRLRTILLTAAAGVAGIALALGLALAAIAIFSRPDDKVVGSGSTGQTTGAKNIADAGHSGVAGGWPTEKPNDSSPGSSASPDETNPTSPKPTPPPPEPPVPSPDKPSPDKPSPDQAPADQAPLDKPTTKTDATEKPDAVPPADQGPNGKPTPPPAGRPDPAGPPAFAPKPLGERVVPEPVAGDFSRLLPGAIPSGEKPTEPTSPAKTPPPDSPAPEIPTTALGGAPSAPEISRPRPREIDVQARLADPIAQLEFPSIPLADFVQLLSDLSTVPMTLDADALRVRRIDPWTPVNVKVQDSTVRGALVAAVQPLKLGLVIHDGAVVISHPVGAEVTRRIVAHDLSDLDRGDETEREWLTQTIAELIAPDQWTEAGGPNVMRWENGKLTMEADEAVHFDALMLGDKLRTARKLTPRGKYAPTVVAPDGVANRAAKSLATKVTLNFNRPTRINEIASRFGKSAGVRLLIDWHELSNAGWTTETTATLSVENLSLGEALDKLLTPRELAYRVIDDATLQITTAAAAAQRQDLELHSVANILKMDGDPQALLERLYDKLGSRRFRAFGGTSVLRYDATSRCVVALLPWRHQVELARALAEWSAPAAE